MFQTKYWSAKIYTTNKTEKDISLLEYDGVENLTKMNNKSAEEGYERAVEKIVQKFNVRDYVYPCESMSEPSSRNCFGGALLLANENDDNLTEESTGEKLILPFSWRLP